MVDLEHDCGLASSDDDARGHGEPVMAARDVA
jgi:hypothetical protein